MAGCAGRAARPNWKMIGDTVWEPGHRNRVMKAADKVELIMDVNMGLTLR